MNVTPVETEFTGRKIELHLRATLHTLSLEEAGELHEALHVALARAYDPTNPLPTRGFGGRDIRRHRTPDAPTTFADLCTDDLT